MPHALLERPFAGSPATHRGGDNTPFPATRRVCERTANRLARLTRGNDACPEFAIRPLQGTGHPISFSSALACPDVFLFDAPCGPNRIALAVDFVQEALAAGQRMLVLVHANDAETLTTRFVERGFRLALCTNPDGLGGAAEPYLERQIAERERSAECQRLAALVNTEAAELERLDALIRIAETHDSHAEELRRELAELHHHATATPGVFGGFVKKLFGGAKVSTDLPTRIAVVEEQLRNLAEPERVAPEVRDRVATAHRDADAAFARAIARPAEIAPTTAAALQVVVATFDSFDRSQLLDDDAAKFDRLLVVDGEDLDEDDFLMAAARAEAWVLFGNPEADGFFTYLWMTLHSTPWQHEGDRLVARLAPMTHTSTEPLYDRPQIELRFAEETLVEVAFPAGTSVVEAKRFLAAELGEAKFLFPGTGVWNESETQVVCECPGLVGAETIELSEGIAEAVAAGDGEAFTTRVAFCKSNWNRETAEAWLTARRLPSSRTAVLPKPLMIA